MYARNVKNQELEFVVSGKLWQRSLVMMDVQTQSLWAHLLGRCMSGPLEGTQLEVVPSVLTPWRSWRTAHPATTVVTMSPIVEMSAEKLKKPTAFVLGTVAQGRAKAWTFVQLLQQPLINDQLNGQPILVALNPQDFTAAIFSRRINDKTVEFSMVDVEQPHLVIDDATQSTWDLNEAAAVDGPLTGTRLERKTAIVSYINAWAQFYPQSEYWTGADSP